MGAEIKILNTEYFFEMVFRPWRAQNTKCWHMQLCRYVYRIRSSKLWSTLHIFKIFNLYLAISQIRQFLLILYSKWRLKGLRIQMEIRPMNRKYRYILPVLNSGHIQNLLPKRILHRSEILIEIVKTPNIKIITWTDIYRLNYKLRRKHINLCANFHQTDRQICLRHNRIRYWSIIFTLCSAPSISKASLGYNPRKFHKMHKYRVR